MWFRYLTWKSEDKANCDKERTAYLFFFFLWALFCLFSLLFDFEPVHRNKKLNSYHWLLGEIRPKIQTRCMESCKFLVCTCIIDSNKATYFSKASTVTCTCTSYYFFAVHGLLTCRSRVIANSMHIKNTPYSMLK